MIDEARKIKEMSVLYSLIDILEQINHDGTAEDICQAVCTKCKAVECRDCPFDSLSSTKLLLKALKGLLDND